MIKIDDFYPEDFKKNEFGYHIELTDIQCYYSLEPTTGRRKALITTINGKHYLLRDFSLGASINEYFFKGKGIIDKTNIEIHFTFTNPSFEQFMEIIRIYKWENRPDKIEIVHKICERNKYRRIVIAQ